MTKKLYKYILFSILMFSSGHFYAQNKQVDSLLLLIKNDKPDTSKVNHLNALAVVLWSNLDTAIICSTSALELAKKIEQENGEKGWQKGIGKSNYFLGVFNFDKGNYPGALSHNMEALQIWERLESISIEPELNQIKILKSKSLGEIGNAYWGQGNYPKALEYQLRSLKLHEELKQEKGIGNTLGNIGNIYSDQKNYPKALEYYLKSLKVSRKFGNIYDMSIDLRNIGNVYRYLNNNGKSLEYLMMALVASKKLGNELEMANNLSSIGALIQNQADSALDHGKTFSELKEQYAKAMEYYLQSMKLDDDQGNQYGTSMNLLNIGGVYAKQGKYKEAEDYFLKALAIDSAIGSLTMIKDLHQGLSEIYYATGDYKRSLKYYKMFASTKDSLFNEDKDREITKHELNYEFEKKESALKAEQDKKEAVAEADKKRQDIYFWLISSVAIAIALIALIVFRSLRVTRKQKIIIEDQKILVEEKQKEILDSIHYAKRIQQSLLPNEKYIHKNLQRLNKKS